MFPVRLGGTQVRNVQDSEFHKVLLSNVPATCIDSGQWARPQRQYGNGKPKASQTGKPSRKNKSADGKKHRQHHGGTHVNVKLCAVVELPC